LNEEREFYLRMATKERWSFPDLQRQLNGALFERTVLAPPKLSSSLRELHPDAASIFKDSYLVEFLNLSRDHSEADLHAGLVESAADVATHAVEFPKLLAFSMLGVQMVA
jgi:predicted nuclease of restriction endonuclease-like (RecB) superfamily